MPKIKITCDSTCDLSPELYGRYQIAVMPMCVVMGDRLCRDGVDVKPAELFSYVAETGTLPTTSAISVGDYENFFRPFVQDGCEVVHDNLFSELSSSHQNARLVAENWEMYMWWFAAASPPAPVILRIGSCPACLLRQ